MQNAEFGVFIPDSSMELRDEAFLVLEGISKPSIPDLGSGRGNESCGIVSVKGLVASSTTSDSGFEMILVFLNRTYSPPTASDTDDKPCCFNLLAM